MTLLKLVTGKRLLIAGVVAAVLGIAGGVVYGVKQVKAERQARTVAELALHGQKQINASTVARLSVTRAAEDSLTESLLAAKTLNGTLVAALAIRVPERDTTIIYRAVPTLVDREKGTRTSTFRDSTFAGTVTGAIHAPPFPDSLQLTYNVVRYEFRPEIGFVEVGDRVVATVSWQGEEIEINAPFMRPPRRPEPRLSPYVQGYWIANSGGFTFSAGLDVKVVAGFRGIVAGAFETNTNSSQLLLGIGWAR